MTTPNSEEKTTQAAAATAEEPKATTKANTAPRKPRVAPSKGKSRKNTTPAKKGAKSAKAAKPAKKQSGVRQGSKTAQVLELLKQPGGTSMKKLMKATGWLPHSVRGFLSGTIGKKMGRKVESAKGEDGNRTYSVKG